MTRYEKKLFKRANKAIKKTEKAIKKSEKLYKKQREATDKFYECVKKTHRKGEWHFNSDPRCGDFVCSECLEHSIVCSKYCPNCGTKMKV